MKKKSYLSTTERSRLHNIQRSLERIRHQCREQCDIAGTRRLFEQFRSVIHLYEDVMCRLGPTVDLMSNPELQVLHGLTFEALGELGVSAEPRLVTLKGYDHHRYGPFLGISSEGSAAAAICRVAFESPKCIALRAKTSLVTGLAIDAERLGAIGEVPVGLNEYRQIRLATGGSILTSTNVGTRVNVRHYMNRHVVVIPPDNYKTAVAQAAKNIADHMRPYWDTPDAKPRPTTVLVEFVGVHHQTQQERILLGIVHKLAKQPNFDHSIHRIGLHRKVESSRQGVITAKQAIDLAVSGGLKDVTLEGIQRAQAERSISLPGLLNYFPPGLLQETLTYASRRGVRVAQRQVVDVETTARNIWMCLSTARHMALELGKYGLAPLTFEEQEVVIHRIQNWFSNWCAAPVYYVDLPSVTAKKVYTEKNAAEGVTRWLEMVARYKVPVVLIDTANKSKGTRLIKRGKNDTKGILCLNEIAALDRVACRMRVKVLWAGGLDFAQSYQLSELGVFGLYITSAAADKRAVTDEYADDPMLPTLKEPQFDKILRVKVLTEAGFMVKRMLTCGRDTEANHLKKLAQAVIRAHESGHDVASGKDKGLRGLLLKCWRISLNASRLPQSETHPSFNERNDSPCD